MTTDERLRLLYARLERENNLLLTLLQRGVPRSKALCRLEADAQGRGGPASVRREAAPPNRPR